MPSRVPHKRAHRIGFEILRLCTLPVVPCPLGLRMHLRWLHSCLTQSRLLCHTWISSVGDQIQIKSGSRCGVPSERCYQRRTDALAHGLIIDCCPLHYRLRRLLRCRIAYGNLCYAILGLALTLPLLDAIGTWYGIRESQQQEELKGQGE